MKRILKAFFVIALLFCLPSFIKAQDVPPSLAKVAEALECPKQGKLSGWQRERGTPLAPSKDVLIEMYSSAGRRVKVSILYQPSEAEAQEVFRRFVSGERTTKIENVGDEACAWGYSDNIAMRKGKLTIYISASSDIGDLLEELDDRERFGLSRTEAVALNKSFARSIDAILSDPAGACRPLQRF